MKTPEIINNLIVSVSEDDSGAFTKLFDLYLSKVLRIAGYYIQSDEVCQEVASDVFLNIWNSRKKLRDIKSFDSYIYTITKNKAFDYLDKLSRQPSFLPVPIEIHSGNNNPEDQLLHTEVEQLLTDSLKSLPARCREIFIMAREEGLKYNEIARILSISEKTVNAQMVTAIKRMGEAMKKYFMIFL